VYYHKILKKDPLGMILERFNVAEERDELIFLDLNRICTLPNVSMMLAFLPNQRLRSRKMSSSRSSATLKSTVGLAKKPASSRH
jgi:hypothetical protein